ncbi:MULTISPECIES: periplasmic heavy metal sensor [unclassified Mesorhizobium]|uniref:periplasmic heavy metal sensor n=1 Tax=unclassified Mesorhizobium TaxID=325217 RepID=UPI000FCC2AF8|nr:MULTISPECIES: periplasmic heavy metal sensor [unclassified Mesorhizobium]RUU61983.1 periplasmic heavy metal sensor [Mesorhizobium sp. M7A.T.Ca.TU.009.01.1.1]RUT85459.1 periplasmic heavy metal sensor [Mesorhizobium sp. M7A.T.Ca.US.000.02.1.1]RUT94668.1 periplasmic heavy metal sensor [Mesorhizobium sp. M7A.T.Ca.US.000.02.2.1]RUU03643.1 periplasmic heavy metal sensor [Mesorhizobium sp. M7A.T.Ca.TU.009.02.1.1]RWN14631.1 MAG: periplasmic heavy metal sensor [Mesorhizobium sp.]
MSTRWVRGLVIASVVLNVFLAGAFVGGAVWLRNAKTGVSLESAGRQLPDQDRKAFREALRQVRVQSRQIILDGQQARQEAADLLQQPVMDEAAVSAALERARNADATVRTRLEQAIVDFAANTSLENRSVLAQALLRHMERRAAVAPKKSP